MKPAGEASEALMHKLLAMLKDGNFRKSHVACPQVVWANEKGKAFISELVGSISPTLEEAWNRAHRLDFRDQGGCMWRVCIDGIASREGRTDQEVAVPPELIVLADTPLEALRFARLEMQALAPDLVCVFSVLVPTYDPRGQGKGRNNQYRGIRLTGNAKLVTKNGRVFDHAKSCRVWNHSPDGFEWGYGGSGPAQLALAILLEEGYSPERAVQLHQHYKADVIARLPSVGWQIRGDQVETWVQESGF